VLDALVAEARLRWGLDPAHGLQVLAAENLVGAPIEPSRPLLIVPLATLRAEAPGEPAPLPGRAGPSGRDPLAVLARLYPADHPVGRFGAADGETVGTLTAASLEASVYLAPVAPELAIAGPWAMPWISARLRQPDGCPWDREQTHQSLRKHLLEEAYEVYDALEAGATPELAGELGDLWLQIVLHAQLAAEEGVFDLADVQAAIASKIVRRHPHVFGDAEARTAGRVRERWEAIKTEQEGREGVFHDVPASLPALLQARKVQRRAAAVGYDWPDLAGPFAKLREEVDELAHEVARTGSPASETEPDPAVFAELGDVLFSIVNLARKVNVDPELALRAASGRFVGRVEHAAELAARDGKDWAALELGSQDAYYDRAKSLQREVPAERSGESV
jgi:MazG family protein